MQNFFRNFMNKNEEKIFEELKIKEYILRYIKELQRHFDLPDSRLKAVIGSIYRDFSFLNKAKTMMKNKFEVIKSFVIKKYGIREKYGKFKN